MNNKPWLMTLREFQKRDLKDFPTYQEYQSVLELQQLELDFLLLCLESLQIKEGDGRRAQLINLIFTYQKEPDLGRLEPICKLLGENVSSERVLLLGIWFSRILDIKQSIFRLRNLLASFSNHRQHVQAALSQELHVPPEVLANYPELAQEFMR